MTRVDLLQQLREFTEAVTSEVMLPVKVQEAGEEQTCRAASVYLMRLPDGTSATKKAPYILHQLITGKDQQQAGQRTESTAQVRSIFAVYCNDEQQGGLMLLNLMERLRIALLRQRVIGRQFALDMEAGLETMAYPDDTAPYYIGEMSSTWKLFPIEREVSVL